MREGADARLARLLAIVPWIAGRDGPTVTEVSQRFGVAEKDLVADLELLFMCGVYPFTPDVLIDVHFADGRVWISMADYFRRPLRFNAQEALALVSAGRTLLSYPDTDPEGPLASALTKLDAVLGLDSGAAVDVGLARVDSATLSALRAAAAQTEKLRIVYYSFGRDLRRERVIHPWRVFNAGGEWYVEAWCEAAAAERNFRVDRIEKLEPVGEGFEPPARPDPSGPSPAVYHPQADDPLWVLDLQPPAHWIAEQYPTESVEQMDPQTLRVGLRAQPGAWLERLLLRAGPHARVVDGDADLARRAAQRILSRYRSHPAPPTP